MGREAGQFKPGQSGNPGGRPATSGLRALLRKRYGDNAEQLVDRLEAMSTSGGRDALPATELLLAYHAGKPVNYVDVTSAPAPVVVVTHADAEIASAARGADDA